MPDSMYSDLLLLKGLNFFPQLDPNWANLPSGNDHHLECPHTKLIDDCLSCLFGNRTGHGPGQCDMGCPRTVVTAVSGVHLNTSHFVFPLQDILLHMAIWRPQTVRVTNYCIVSISVYLHSAFAGPFYCCAIVFHACIIRPGTCSPSQLPGGVLPSLLYRFLWVQKDQVDRAIFLFPLQATTQPLGPCSMR